MRAALLALLVAAEVAAAPRVLNRLGPYPRLDRRDRLGGAAVDVSLLRVLPSTASIPGGECSGQTITGTRGESINFSRSSGANCQKADGTWVAVTSNQPRVSNLPGQPALLIEQSAQNLVLRNRDLANAAWTATNTTCARDAVGIDGASNTASTCTASAANGTVLQTLTTSGTRTFSIFVKRVSGSSAIEVTRNNGSTWTALTSSNCFNATTYAAQSVSSGSWSRCWVASTVTNPVVGIRIVGSGDSFVVDALQDESRNFIDTPTSPIFVDGTSVTRTSEYSALSHPVGFNNAAGCYAAKIFKPTKDYGGANPRVFNSTAALLVAINTGAYFNSTGVATVTYSPTFGVLTDLIATWSNATGLISVSANAGTPGTAVYGGTALGANVRVGTDAGGTQSLNGYLANIRFGATTGDCAQ